MIKVTNLSGFGGVVSRPITYVGSDSDFNTDTPSASFTFRPAGRTRLIVVLMFIRDNDVAAAADVTSVTVDGSSMTQQRDSGSFNEGVTIGNSIWSLQTTKGGTLTISASISFSGTMDTTDFYVWELYGFNPTPVLITSEGGTGGTPNDNTFDTTSCDVVFLAGVNDNSPTESISWTGGNVANITPINISRAIGIDSNPPNSATTDYDISGGQCNAYAIVGYQKA